MDRAVKDQGNVSTVGDNINAPNAGWSFGSEVPQAFDTHVEKSVPLYPEGHELILRISDYFLSDTSTVYDLGCSTGELLLKLSRRHRDRSHLRMIGIDREDGMVGRARQKCAGEERIRIDCEDLNSCELDRPDFVISYYTMQFIRPAFRQELFNRIFESLNWGGGFVLFEKVRAPDARFQDMMTGLYNDYKLERGFTGEEIIAKSRSLKGVLEPFSTAANFEMLHRAGFKDTLTVMKYICFEGILAIK